MLNKILIEKTSVNKARVDNYKSNNKRDNKIDFEKLKI